MPNHKHNHFSESDSNQKPGSLARLNRIHDEMMRGYKFVERFDEMPVVTFYGSAQAKPDSPHYQMAYKIGRELSKRGIAVVTGGGPGIMEAGNKGAYDAGGVSIGLGIELEGLSERPNPYTTHRMDFHYFFVRKVMLSHIAQAYVYFPGGVGTLDEFFELSTLVMTNKLHQEPIIILMGEDYWRGLFDWLGKTVAGKYQAFSDQEFHIWHVTDSIDDAMDKLMKTPSIIELHESV